LFDLLTDTVQQRAALLACLGIHFVLPVGPRVPRMFYAE